jgi:hypothetical protein
MLRYPAFLLVSCIALAQAPTSCVVDTLVIAPNATPVQLGTVQISWTQFNYNTNTVAAGQLTYTVNNGLVGGTANPLCLVPTDHSSQSVAYSVHITTGPGVQAVQTYWKVPTNGGPFTINQITVAYTPGLNTNINPIQITTVGGVAGYALTLNSNLIPTWLPEAGGITYCPTGICNSTGSAWGTSYTVGTAPNNLVQLNGSGQLPAVSAALLTNLGNAGTASGLNLSSFYSPSLSVTLNPSGGNGAGTSPNLTEAVGIDAPGIVSGVIFFVTGSNPAANSGLLRYSFTNVGTNGGTCTFNFGLNNPPAGATPLLVQNTQIGSFRLNSANTALAASTQYIIQFTCFTY